MKYAACVDYLLSSILYLGTHEYYWARSPGALASELSLDEQKLQAMFDEFPGLFRKSHRTATNGQHYYALQARYAQREGEDTKDPEEISYIAALETDKLDMLLRFVMQMTEHERTGRRGVVANIVSIVAVAVSAAAVITAALVRL
jgi:hypothetical protein